MTDKEKSALSQAQLTDVTGGTTANVLNSEISGPITATGPSKNAATGPACPYCGCPNFTYDMQGWCTCLSCGKRWY